MVSPLTITVFSRTFARKGFIGDPVAVELHLRHNQQPTGTITVAADHTYASALLADGARVTIGYAGLQVMSGPVRAKSGTSGKDSTLVLTVEDDWRVLTRVLGWPVPTGLITAQGADDKAYDTKTGPAETVLKWFVSRNATRLGLPVTVAPDLGRGATVTVSMRMHPLADRLLPLVDQAGIGVTVRQVGAGVQVDAYTPAWYPRDLTEMSGVVTAWEWEQNPPTVTRVVVGGGGEGVNRDFRAYIAAALESSWGDKIEVFRDARDAYSDADQARDAWVDAVADQKGKAKDLAVATAAATRATRALAVATNAVAVADHQRTLHPGTTATDNYDAAVSARTDAQGDLTSANTDKTAATTANNTAVALVASTLAASNAAYAGYIAELDARGAESLAEGAPTTGLKLTLAETDTFRYGRTIRVGDLVTTVLVPGAAPVTDVLREAVLSWSVSDGFLVTPVVGDRADDPNRTFARAIASLARAVRNQRSST